MSSGIFDDVGRPWEENSQKPANGEDHLPPWTQEHGYTPPTIFPATPFRWDDMEAVGPREWVYGHFLIRRFVSVLGAPGGTGKTAYAFAVALSVVTGKPLLGEPVHDRGNVWIYNLEDPKDELLRRLRAATLRHDIKQIDVEGRLFLDSGRDRPLVIAQRTETGAIVANPILEPMIEELQTRAIKVHIVDPFVRSHRLEENANEQIDFATALWGRVAEEADCAVLLVHHFRKGGQPGTADAFRGASAMIDAARAALSMSVMSQDEASKLGVPEDARWRHIRVDNAKLNLAPPPERSLWLQLVGQDLGNGTELRPADQAQSVVRWEPPSPWDGLPMSSAIKALEEIDQGLPGSEEFYTDSRRGEASPRWAGHVVIANANPGMSQSQASSVLNQWLQSGVLIRGNYVSPKRREPVACVRVEMAKLREMATQITPDPIPDWGG